MGTSFVAGTSGRVQTVPFAVSTTSDMPPGQGDGPAIGTPTLAAGADITSWSFEDSVNNEPVYTFESPANAQGVIYPIHLRGGLSPGAKVQVSGTYDAGAAPSSRFVNGQYVYMTLIVSKLTGWGYHGLVAKITNYKQSAQAGGKAQEFSFNADLQAAPPVPTLT